MPDLLLILCYSAIDRCISLRYEILVVHRRFWLSSVELDSGDRGAEGSGGVGWRRVVDEGRLDGSLLHGHACEWLTGVGHTVCLGRSGNGGGNGDGLLCDGTVGVFVPVRSYGEASCIRGHFSISCLHQLSSPKQLVSYCPIS